MRRRESNSDSAIATDSFLDIIANIVGILIILIVIAGVRVSHAPVMLTSESVTSEPEAPEPQRTPQLPEVEPIPVSAPPAVVEADPLPELLSKAEALEREIQNIEQELAAGQQHLAAMSAEEREIRNKLQAASSRLKRELDEIQAQRAKLQQAALVKDELSSRLINTQFALQNIQRKPPPSKKLQHWITPISNTVEGKEIHFRLLHNQVSYLPIEDLVERLRMQVEQRKDWLLKYNRHQGQVGPVQGFTMNYTIQRQEMSVIDELRYGRPMIQVGVSEWTLEAEPDVPAESLDEVQGRGSRFVRKLQTAETGTTLTFWVYPDSYGMYRQLEGLAHSAGFTVAARPMPFGVRIAGSPHGTRSAGQ